MVHEEKEGHEYKDCRALVAGDNDGYNGPRYGLKVVKGREFPRSYYMSTNSNCEVKKIFQCSYTRKITEIVYKGTHDHPKPRPTGHRSYISTRR